MCIYEITCLHALAQYGMLHDVIGLGWIINCRISLHYHVYSMCMSCHIIRKRKCDDMMVCYVMQYHVTYYIIIGCDNSLSCHCVGYMYGHNVLIYHVHTYVYIYIYMYVYIHTYIYIYMYRERERCMCIYIYVIMRQYTYCIMACHCGTLALRN